MSTPQDGGPAFPQHVAFNPNGEAVTAGMYFAEGPGMSLRDWFAGMALQGQVSTDQGFEAESDKIAAWSYNLADAMLTARERKEEP